MSVHLTDQIIVTNHQTLPVLGERSENLTAKTSWSIFPVIDGTVYKARIHVDYVWHPTGWWAPSGQSLAEWSESATPLPSSLQAPQTDFGSLIQHATGGGAARIPSYALSYALPHEQGKVETHGWIVSSDGVRDPPKHLIFEIEGGQLIYRQTSECRPYSQVQGN